ncbi:hypothetical protein JL49_23955 [Pseudoalteromonas luteoviolacea]|nr:hypothetical protein JL49_23955 [Pseudoalteromonas luteoviolacea]
MTFSSLDCSFFSKRGVHRVLLQDGASFALHKELAETFAGRFNTTSPAAIELHVTYSASSLVR